LFQANVSMIGIVVTLVILAMTVPVLVYVYFLYIVKWQIFELRKKMSFILVNFI
jgi:hypothetical protein